MASPTGVIPDEFLTPYKRTEAFEYLLKLAIPGDLKVKFWIGWCQWCNTHNTPQERTKLENSGTD